MTTKGFRLDPTRPAFTPRAVANNSGLPTKVGKETDGSLSSGDVRSPTSSSDEEVCICNRPRGLIVCRRCGFQDEGRVRTTCPRHRNRHALMDLQVCPDCRAYTLKEVQL